MLSSKNERTIQHLYLWPQLFGPALAGFVASVPLVIAGGAFLGVVMYSKNASSWWGYAVAAVFVLVVIIMSTAYCNFKVNGKKWRRIVEEASAGTMDAQDAKDELADAKNSYPVAMMSAGHMAKRAGSEAANTMLTTLGAAMAAEQLIARGHIVSEHAKDVAHLAKVELASPERVRLLKRVTLAIPLVLTLAGLAFDGISTHNTNAANRASAQAAIGHIRNATAADLENFRVDEIHNSYDIFAELPGTDVWYEGGYVSIDLNASGQIEDGFYAVFAQGGNLQTAAAYYEELRRIVGKIGPESDYLTRCSLTDELLSATPGEEEQTFDLAEDAWAYHKLAKHNKYIDGETREVAVCELTVYP